MRIVRESGKSIASVAKLVTVSVPFYKVNRGLTTEQARRVLKAFREHRFHALYASACAAGGVPRTPVGRRRPRHGHSEGRPDPPARRGKLRFVHPKTDAPERTIPPLPSLCVEALEEHRKQQFAERSDRWNDWEEHGLIFPSRRGTPMEPDNLRRSWGAIRKAAGLGDMRFHGLRHTSVTLLLNLGVPPQVVRDIVGHSDIAVTMTIYAHVSLDDKRNALGKLDNALG
ncbi:site-specific integrase [Streptosporangium canum]|uniref:tyrosine-type recombinase/integrase n=1 Tax=Streptosporangium canum TaxID=324952 RepID=UPI0034246BD3